MAITRERKEELVAEYNDLLSNTDGFIITEYRGLTVAQMDGFRNELREKSGGAYTVTKNTLFKIALEQSGWVVPDELLKGPVAVVFGNGNLPAVAKDVIEFDKENEIFIVKGGVMSTTIFGADDVDAVSKLPTIEEIRAQIAGMFNIPSQLLGLFTQPPSQLVGVVHAASSQVVNVLSAYVQKQESESEAG